MKARVYFTPEGVTAVCMGGLRPALNDAFVEVSVMRDVGIADFEMIEGEPRLRTGTIAGRESFKRNMQ